MKLYYFDISGRAGPARLMLKSAGVEFEDIRFKREEWIAKYKAMTPTGQCPFLELDDGSILAQSLAINTYIADKTGFMPSDAVKQARVYELMASFEDVRLPCTSTTHF